MEYPELHVIFKTKPPYKAIKHFKSKLYLRINQWMNETFFISTFLMRSASTFKIADSFISIWNWPDKQRILNSKSRKNSLFVWLCKMSYVHSARDQLKSISNLNLLEIFLQRSSRSALKSTFKIFPIKMKKLKEINEI